MSTPTETTPDTTKCTPEEWKARIYRNEDKSQGYGLSVRGMARRIVGDFDAFTRGGV